jgi:hypothetical protein
MPLPTVNQFLAKLEASPADAAEFDRYAGGRTRRQAVEATLAAVKATLAENEASKAKLAATKAKQAALEAARKSQSIMKTPITPTPAPITTITAAQFSQPKGAFMNLAEFNKLSHQERNRFIREGGRLTE